MCAVIGQTGTGLRPGAGAAGAAGGIEAPPRAQPTPGGAQQPAEPQPGPEDQAGSDQEPPQPAAQLGGAAPPSSQESRKKKHFAAELNDAYGFFSHYNVSGRVLWEIFRDISITKFIQQNTSIPISHFIVKIIM